MKKYFDEQTQHILLAGIHEIPEYAVEITDEDEAEILRQYHLGHITLEDGNVVCIPVVVSAEEKLAEVKNFKLGEINHLRDVALQSGFEFEGNRYDSDDKSIQRITGLVTQTLLNPDFSTDYITQDNKIVHLNQIQLKALGEAASAHEALNVFKARQLKDAVLVASTIEEVEAIKW